MIENREYSICVDICGIREVFMWSIGGCICIGICMVSVRSGRIGYVCGIFMMCVMCEGIYDCGVYLMCL